MIQTQDIKLAQQRLRGVVLHTALLPFPAAASGARLFLKPEMFQPTGAFKLRGAYNAIGALTEPERGRGVITFSSGNHAQAVAYAARMLGCRAVVVMPGNASSVKRERTAALGAEIVTVGNSHDERRIRAEELAAQEGLTIISPHSGNALIAGHGTIGLEILADLPLVETVLVPVGAGGLIAGVAVALKSARSDIKVIGVEPELAARGQASLRAGRQVAFSAEDVARTAADGLRAQQIPDDPWRYLSTLVDGIVTVTEAEILDTVRRLAVDGHLIAEPSGAVSLAAALHHAHELPASQATVAVLTGGNVDTALLVDALQREPLATAEVGVS